MRELFSLSPFFWKYRLRLTAGFAFVILSNYFNVLSPQVTGFVIDHVQRALSLQGYRAPVVYAGYDRSVRLLIDWIRQWGSNVATVVALCGVVILLLALLRGIFLFMMRQTLIVMSRYVEYEQKNQIFSHYQLLDTAFYREQRTGDLMNRITEDVSRVRMFTGPAVMYIANLVSVISLSLFFMFRRNMELTFYVLLPLPLLAIAIYYINDLIHRRSERIQETLSDLTTHAQEAYSGIRVVKAFAQEHALSGFFRKLTERYKKEVLGLVKVESLYFPSISLLIGLSTLLTIMIGGLYYIRGEQDISLSTIVEFVMYINMLTFPVSAIGLTASMVQRAAASQQRINQFLSARPAVTDSPDAVDRSIRGRIIFKHVYFTYADTGIQALRDISFSIEPGEKVAIVGRTGSGKSTLVQLLLRQFDCQSGQIFVDQIPLQQFQLRSLRSQVGYVPQDVFLFSDTVRANIAFGADMVDQGRVVEAAKLACIDQEINELSAGYDTIVGERGVMLSGGQKQRISLARALLRNPSILLLDDGMSAVDARTEQQISLGLQQYWKDKTAVIVTHRIFSLLEFDKVLVLDEGRLVESGTPAALLRACGHYAAMYKRQQQEQAGG
jgi:ATP-binding cassette, subfamily B, multidrug efflux pump